MLHIYADSEVQADSTSAARNDCITHIKISVNTGELKGAGISNSHGIVLQLKNGQTLQGNITGPSYNNMPYTQEMNFSSEFHTGSQCVRISDIDEVSLVPKRDEIWYLSEIKTYVKVGEGPYKELPSDLVSMQLETDNTDRPHCPYETPACECKPKAKKCIFHLKVEEIMTFTSYQKRSIDEEEKLSDSVRGTQGVIYGIGLDGQERPLEQYESRKCAKNFDPAKCSTPLFVDGKSYRMAIAINGLIPGPTLIVHEQQTVVIHVHNDLSSEGISIHWHGMHQIGTPWMDGVGQVTQCHIAASSRFTYSFTASPSGTFWYHSHSGAQRTEGFFGALIVREGREKQNTTRELLNGHGVQQFEDLPDKHSITLLDWQRESSISIFTQLHASLGFHPGVSVGEIPPSNKYSKYSSTHSFDDGEVGPIPYFSGLINGKGRHIKVPYVQTRLSIFVVERGKSYRFRLIGAQGLYAYKFSIDGHKLTVVGTDGYWIEPQKDIDYIIIHSGE